MLKIFKEPLVQFLAVGLALFLVYELAVGGDDRDEGSRTVMVDREALLEFVQYRSKAFERSVFEEKLSSLSGPELERLIDDFVREEVLYKEAKALALEKEDYVIRRRLVQKVEFVAEGFAEASVALDEAAVQRYFDSNKQDYYVQPYVTFTHVFFDKDKHGDDTLALARAKLTELHRTRASFSDAPGHGDRFLYHVNYVERTPEFVASHFGMPMSKAVFELEPSDIVWRGPFVSPYGAHVVMLTKNEPGRVPELAEVRGRVEEDAQRALVRERKAQAIDNIIDTYDVQITYKPSDPAAAEQ